MQKNPLLKKGLVFGIILLFIGVGIHPAFANEISITRKVDSKDDCNCKPVSNLHLITLERLSNKLDRLLDRAEIYTGIISILYRHKPDITEELKELSNRITTLRESNDDLNSVFEYGLHDIICDALDYYIDLLLDYGNYLLSIMEKYPTLIPFIYPLFLSLDILLIELFILYYGVFMCN